MKIEQIFHNSEPPGDSVLAQLPCHLSSGEVLDTESITHLKSLKINDESLIYNESSLNN